MRSRWAFVASALVAVAACGPTHAGSSRPPPSGGVVEYHAARPPEGRPVVAAEARARVEARPDAEAPPAEGAVRRDINHVLVTGQSLAVGVAGAPALSLTQPFGNLMFNTGVMAGGEGLDELVPLVEGDNIPGSKAIVETMSSAFANLVSELALADGGDGHDLLLSVHAVGARTYAQLKKGTKPYANGMAQVVAARDIAKRLGKSYVVRAVANVHGESDHAEKSTRYLADLLEWQADYESDIRALTGQAEPVPMFHTQISSWTRMMGGTETSAIPGAQLAAHVQSKGKIVLVGPKYHLRYSRDGVHLTSAGYRHMGEDYAKAYRRVILEREPWEPLRPVSISRDGAIITVRFVVPRPPLALDTTLVSDPGNYGFEYADAGPSSPTITKIELAGSDSVVITLSRAPTGEDRHLRYAFTGVKGARSGPETGARGNLRDSDATPSRSGQKLYNWCVHFDESVP